MVLIAVIQAEPSLADRLGQALPTHTLIQQDGSQPLPGECRLAIHCRPHWDPAWCPPPAPITILCCPRPPLQPLAAFFSGIDDWFPPDAPATRIQAVVARLLAETGR